MIPLRVVLDTNVTLDWFVFRNPAIGPLASAIEQRSVVWLTCAEMRAELAHVLAHAGLGGRAVDVEQVLTSVDRLTERVFLPAVLPATRPHCSDASDQMFLDLAIEQGARWLLTRDRALLKVARKAAARGLAIIVPEAWSPPLMQLSRA